MKKPTQYVSEIRWSDCWNTFNGPIPAYAALELVELADPDGILRVTRPTADSITNVLVNGPSIIPINGYGLCTADSPIHVLYDPLGQAPQGPTVIGQSFGTLSNSFYLSKGFGGVVRTGFNAVGVGSPALNVMQAFNNSGDPTGTIAKFADVRVTAVSGPLTDRCPGRTLKYDPDTVPVGTWSDVANVDDCWVVERNNKVLLPGTTRYLGEYVGTLTADKKPVYAVDLGNKTGFTGVKIPMLNWSCNQATGLATLTKETWTFEDGRLITAVP